MERRTYAISTTVFGVERFKQQALQGGEQVLVEQGGVSFARRQLGLRRLPAAVRGA